MLGVGLSATGAAARRRPFPPGALIDLDFRQDRYLLAGAPKSFDEMFAYGGSGLRSFADAAGNLVWNAHNLLLNSESPATQDVTVTAGAAYTLAMSGTGSVVLSGAGAATATEGAPVSVSASGSSLTVTVSGQVTRFWLYRSDLGGMAANPDNALGAGFETYVPSGSTPAFKARRRARLNGTPAGMIHESGARTNAARHSHNLADAYWIKNNQAGVTAAGTIAGVPAWEISDSSPALYGHCAAGAGTLAGVHAVSCLVRKNPAQTSLFGLRLSVGSGQFCGISLDTMTGAIKDQWNDGLVLGPGGAQMRGAADMGNHWHVWFTYDPSGLTGLNATADIQLFPAHDDLSQSSGSAVTGSHVCTAIQAEAGYLPSSYIPTADSAVTRPAETLEIRAAILPAAMPEAVTVAVQGRMSYADQNAYATVIPFAWQADSGNRIRSELSTNGADTGRMFFVQKTGGAQTVASTPAPGKTPGAEVPFFYASRYSAAEIQGAADGEVTAAAAASGLPDLAGQGIALGHTLSGTLGGFRLWDRDLGGSGIARLAL